MFGGKAALATHAGCLVLKRALGKGLAALRDGSVDSIPSWSVGSYQFGSRSPLSFFTSLRLLQREGF